MFTLLQYPLLTDLTTIFCDDGYRILPAAPTAERNIFTNKNKKKREFFRFYATLSPKQKDTILTSKCSIRKSIAKK